MTKNKEARDEERQLNMAKMSILEELYLEAGINDKRKKSIEGSDLFFLSSHSLLMEGIDFDPIYTPLKHLGYKSVLSVLGPLYAEGFYPYTLSIKLSLSSRFNLSQIKELWVGISAAFKEHKIEHIELDLTPSVTGLIISLSSMGKQERKIFVQRTKPKASDLLCISGSLGAAYMGLHVLEREKALFEKEKIQPNLERYRALLQSYLNPHIERELIDSLYGSQLMPTAGQFLINGLADAVKNLCHKNQLGAKIFLDKIPIGSHISEMAKEIGIDPLTSILNGGDDYKFLFTIPLEKHQELKKEIPQIDIIGHLNNLESGTLLITPDGAELPLKAQAWDK